MTYSDFKTIQDVQDKFSISISSGGSFFTNIPEIQPSKLLQDILAEYVPLALNIDTEKARSELIITPVLVEVYKLFDCQISFFSGLEFNVDTDQGLGGPCDYIVSRSPHQLFITAPVVCVLKAENENLAWAYSSCLAKMIAAQRFNQTEEHTIETNFPTTIWGIATTGSAWRFLRLEGQEAFIDYDEYQITQIAKILGIFRHIIKVSN